MSFFKTIECHMKQLFASVKYNLCLLLDSCRHVSHWWKVTILAHTFIHAFGGRAWAHFPEQQLVIEPSEYKVAIFYFFYKIKPTKYMMSQCIWWIQGMGEGPPFSARNFFGPPPYKQVWTTVSNLCLKWLSERVLYMNKFYKIMLVIVAFYL